MNSQSIASQIYAKFGFPPTPSQKKVTEQVSEWISQPADGTIFILNGYAGTGKTTLVSAFTAVLREMGVKPVCLAPTGRAAKVFSHISGEKALTIHKKIYRQKSLVDEKGSFVLDINREKNACFIVDEASMLANSSGGESEIFGSGALMDDLVQYVNSGSGCRLMLVGDAAQLPPVGMTDSPALDPRRMGVYGGVEYASMDDVVRQQSESGVLFNATMVRMMIENNINEIPMFRTEGFKEIGVLSGGDFTEKLEECYSRYGRDETIVITRSNKRANRFNDAIRRHVLEAEEEIEAGDMLMVVKNNYHYTERDADSPTGFIANGDIVKLRRLRRFEDLYGFRFAQATVQLVDYGDYEVECKIFLDTIHSESPSLTKEQQMKLWRGVEGDYMDLTKAKRFKEIRENDHFNALQVKMAYAITCHKAQGGQWSAVFIDQMLFGEETMSRDLLRWLYTAITRSTHRLYFVNFDERFFEKQ